MTCEISLKSELLDLLSVVGCRVLSNRSALNYLIRAVREYTSKDDWCAGNRVLIYKDVNDIAFEHGVSVRTINNWEHAICDAFGLRIIARPNRRRYAERCPKTGRILFGYGLELTGLREMLPVLQSIKEEFAILHQRRSELKQQLTHARGRVRQLATALYCQCRQTDNYELEAQGRNLEDKVCHRVPEYASVIDLEQMILVADRVREDLEQLLILCKSCGSDVKISDQSESCFRPIQLPTKHLSYPSDNCSALVDCLRRSLPLGSPDVRSHSVIPFADPTRIGAVNVQPATAIQAASKRFQAHLPPTRHAPSQNQIVAAAKGFAGEMGIDGDTWDFACQVMGEYPAALCVLVTDNARDRGIRSPGGYFRSLAKRAITGDLSLDQSIYGAWHNRQRAEVCHA